MTVCYYWCVILLLLLTNFHLFYLFSLHGKPADFIWTPIFRLASLRWNHKIQITPLSHSGIKWTYKLKAEEFGNGPDQKLKNLRGKHTHFVFILCRIWLFLGLKPCKFYFYYFYNLGQVQIKRVKYSKTIMGTNTSQDGHKPNLDPTLSLSLAFTLSLMCFVLSLVFGLKARIPARCHLVLITYLNQLSK